MNSKILKWNFIFQYGYVITNIINSVILLPLYLRRIDSSTLGLWLATGNILSLMTLADPGVGDVLQQKIAQLRGKNENSEIGLTIGSGLSAAGIILLISVLAGFIFYFLIGTIINKDVSQYKGLQAALMISVIATGMSLVSFSLSGINQGMHNSAPVAISSLTGNFLFLITNMLLLYFGFGVISIAFANLCRAVYINIFNYGALRKILQQEQLSINFNGGHFKRFIKIFSFTSLSRIIGGFAASMDMIVLGRFVAPSMITIFEINKRPIQMTQSLVGRHSVALMPVISHANGKGDREGIKTLINTQFKYYVYAAIFISIIFFLNYTNLITAWTGAGKYAGDQIIFLLIANFFFDLLGYFMANMGYALGDIKVNSFINIFKGIVSGVLYYFATKAYGIIGLLVAIFTLNILIDFIFFSYRIYQLGYIDRKAMGKSFVLWSMIIPVSSLAGWGFSNLFNLVIPQSMHITKIILNSGCFTVFFIALVLVADRTLRALVVNWTESFFKVDFTQQNIHKKQKKPMAKLVVMLRVKDGMFFVKEWLSCFEKLADEIVVLDNGSTDGTYEVLKAHPKVVDIIRTAGYNEGRDKNLLYAHVRQRNPDWCLWLDIDEIFEPGLTRSHFDRLMKNRYINKYAFRRFHFTDREHFAGSWYRLNYTSGHDRILWRENPAGYFQDLIIDSPNVKGIKGLKKNTNFRLKHLGYINKELVDKKAEIYRAIVPENEEIFQSMYLRGEREIKWVDDRNNLQVILINNLLNAIQLTHIFPKVIRRIKRYI